MGSDAVNQFLTSLAVDRKVSASTQNLALSAILFLYRKVLQCDTLKFNAVRVQAPDRIPIVLSVAVYDLRRVRDRTTITFLEGNERRIAFGSVELDRGSLAEPVGGRLNRLEGTNESPSQVRIWRIGSPPWAILCGRPVRS